MPSTPRGTRQRGPRNRKPNNNTIPLSPKEAQTHKQEGTTTPPPHPRYDNQNSPNTTTAAARHRKNISRTVNQVTYTRYGAHEHQSSRPSATITNLHSVTSGAITPRPPLTPRLKRLSLPSHRHDRHYAREPHAGPALVSPPLAATRKPPRMRLYNSPTVARQPKVNTTPQLHSPPDDKFTRE